MSRIDGLSSALVKRHLEAELREAGLSRKHSGAAISIFCRFLDQGFEIDRRSFFGRVFTKLKRFHESGAAPRDTGFSRGGN